MTAFESTVTELLGRGITVRFQASGDSMYPSIRNGEHVHVAPVEPSSLRIGDVILARAQRGLTAHRLVKLAGGAATTRGDNAIGHDAAVPFNEILGRITHIERDGAMLKVPATPFRRNLLSLSQLIRSVCELISSSSRSPRRAALQCTRFSACSANTPALEQRHSHLRER